MSEDWPKAIQYFETAIQAFLKSLDRCRLSCDKPFDQGWFPDFVSSVASKIGAKSFNTDICQKINRGFSYKVLEGSVLLRFWLFKLTQNFRSDDIYLLIYSFGFTEQFLQGNVPFRHLLNEESLFIFY